MTVALLHPRSLRSLELVINGDFEQSAQVGWTEHIATTNYLLERDTDFDYDLDYEQYLYMGTGGGFLELYQTTFVPSTDIHFSVNAKLAAHDDSPAAWAGAAVVISYLKRNGSVLGKTYIASRSAGCPWTQTSRTHVIDAPDSLWHSYSFNISDELANLPAIDPPSIEKIRVSLFIEAEHC